jgi:hypothetical protein
MTPDSNGPATHCLEDGARRTIDVRCQDERIKVVKALTLFVGWCILFVLCWPLALLALVLLPVVWLVSLPLRLIGITVGAAFTLIRALLFLPSRLLGSRKCQCNA